MEISHILAHAICVLVYSVSAYPQDATRGQFPFIVYIVPGPTPNLTASHGCTGTLLSLSWVLSTGSCLGDHITSNITLIAGVTNIREYVTHEPGLQIRAVAREVVHWDMSGVSQNFSNLQPYPDLTLLQTTTPFHKDRLVRPAPVQEAIYQADCVVAGWGYQESNPGWIEGHYLKWTNVLKVLRYKECRVYGLVEFSTQVCAMLPPENLSLKGYCGNPIVCGGVLYGIRHSRTYYRNDLFKMDIFVNISPFLHWIRQFVGDMQRKKIADASQEGLSSAAKCFTGVVFMTGLITLLCVQWQ